MPSLHHIGGTFEQRNNVEKIHSFYAFFFKKYQGYYSYQRQQNDITVCCNLYYLA